MASVDEKQGHGRVLEFDKVTKSFAKTDSNEITHALAEVNLTIQPGEFVSIVGTSGCGKSTILRLIAGLIRPTTGEIRLGGKPIVGAGPDRGMVFQKATLFPWLTVEKNVSFSLRMQKKQDKELVEHMLKMVGLEDFRKDYPHQLSGGMAQRVALVRSLINHPDILLLDEPTNHLDLDAIAWLEEFLINFENTVIVVSHDRYFLNKVCTNIADMDYGKIQLYAGNYDFWYESSQLLVRQMKEANKKKEEKIKELQEFISRFSANASKSKQATSRKRALEKIQLDDIRPSSRKYPYIDFRPNREIGNEVLTVDGISKTIDGVKVLDNISFIVGHDDKIAFVGGNELAKTTLFKILAGEMEPDEGSYKWGVTTSQSYFPKDNTAIFDSDELIVDWLTQYSEIKDATYVRGFLGRMLFAGEDGVKKMRVLSGGEKVRVLLSRMMIMGSNVLIFDEPTDHLDMESITALNNGMIKFPGVILFACRDHQVVQTTANRIIEFLPDGSMVDKVSTYDEYLESDVMARKRQVYNTTADEEADD